MDRALDLWTPLVSLPMILWCLWDRPLDSSALISPVVIIGGHRSFGSEQTTVQSKANRL